VNGQYQSLGHEKLIRIDRLVNQSSVAEPKVCPPSVLENAILNLNLLSGISPDQSKENCR